MTMKLSYPSQVCSSKEITTKLKRTMTRRVRFRPYVSCLLGGGDGVPQTLTKLTTLVNTYIIKLTLISVTCLVILLHHMYVKPFKLTRSNRAETLSLSFLLVISSMNAIKAAFSENGVIPEGPNESLLRFSES